MRARSTSSSRRTRRSGASSGTSAAESPRRSTSWASRSSSTSPSRAPSSFRSSTAIRRIAGAAGLKSVAFGHAADGNLHVHLWREGKDPAARTLFEKTATEIYAETVRLGGTVTGEHGVGITSRDVLPLYRPPAFLAAMRAIKQALDPNGILNPGKVIPEPGSRD